MSRIIKQVQINTSPVVINSRRLPASEEKKNTCEEKISHEAQPPDAFLAAQQEAAGLIAKAKREMEEQSAIIYKDSEEAGYAAGYEKGSAEGYAKGSAEGNSKGYSEGHALGEKAAKAKMETSVLNATGEASRIITAANQQVKQTILSAERQIVEIALAIANKILACEIDANTQTVIAVVKQAMDKVRNQEQITVRVNPSDYVSVIAAKGELDAILQREQSIEFTADQTVSRGGCVIDSAFGSADARVETQLQALQVAIRSLLP